MSFKIQRFVIRGLYKSRDYSIEIRENKIVMVGVNGLGKTTVVTLLYLLLSRQWERLIDFDFESLSIVIDDVEYTLRQEEEERSTTALTRRLRARIMRSTPGDSYHSLASDTYERLAAVAVQRGREALAVELDRVLPIPTQVCRRIAADVSLASKYFNKPLQSQLEGLLTQHMNDCQVLYLPTYRRIEKDLSLLFPDLEESINSFQRHKGPLAAEMRRGYIELVEFGMEDVDGTFRRVQTELVRTARTELNALAGGYLRDVIRGEGEGYAIDTFLKLDNSTINRILNRVEEETLSDTDKARLRGVIEKLKTPPASGLEPVDKYTAHFFSKLISVDAALSDREQLITRFTEVCNKYFTDKQIYYDDKDSSISMRLLSTGRPLPLKSLSSGEKQIVSLFSHLYLRDRGKVFVIIDEPELSLSVTWQKQLLPDILETGNCVFLAAVTHSPFIFDNSLDPFAVDLSECIKEVTQ